MATSILSRTFVDGLDKKLVLNNSQWAATMNIGTDWTRLRIGWRWALTDSGANITGASPGFMIGTMSSPASGMTNGPLGNSCSHFFGIIQRAANPTVTRQTTGFLRYGAWVPASAKKIGSTLTEGTGLNSLQIGYQPGTIRTAHIIEITKGSPNFTIQQVTMSSTTGVNDMSLAGLEAAMNSATMAGAEIELDNVNAAYTLSSAVTQAVSESDGAFNAVVVGWTKTTNDMEFSEVLFAKMA